ncbi:YdcF family protein [Candidatus Gracilibacteria bacterium]|nr:YdcF family protein [Candidatus Gracilibacteria bacterium]
MKIIFGTIFLFITLFLVTHGIFNNKVSHNLQTYTVIYGSKVELDGEPSRRLQARLSAGLDVYDEFGGKIIVSGGVGIEGFDEAEVMKEYLVERGVNEDDIIQDSDGYTTRKTSENAFQIITERERKIEEVQVIGVSQWFHIPRVKLSLRQEGFQNVSGISPKYFEVRDIYSFLREIPAYIKYSL